MILINVILLGQVNIILEEKSEFWVNLHNNLHVLEHKNYSEDFHEGDFYFVWASERSGYSQLYLYKYDTELGQGINLSCERPIGGGGNWVVEKYDKLIFPLSS